MFDRDVVQRLVDAQPFDVRKASIREMNRLVNTIETELGVRFVRMEFGIPGLPTPDIAVRAEVEALRDRRVGHVYAPFDGLPELCAEAARFVKLYLDLDVPASCCIPTVGAMEGCFASMALANRMHADRHTLLFLRPGFPVNLLQARFLGMKVDGIDFYDHRGSALLDAVERRLAQGGVAAMLWSSPNNPSWIVLQESELEGLGRLCDRYDVVAIEDLAYFGMDVRQDYLNPGVPPFQPTVLRYTRNGICIISSSKIFSYAGQRIALAILHPDLAARRLPDLTERLGTPLVRHAFVHGIQYPLIASVPEGPQYGLHALLKAANGGDRSLFAAAWEYARRARATKEIFLRHGFRLVYDNDLGEPLADGFYFTVSHPRYAHGADLAVELLHYGVSAITLDSTGSCRTEGLRACVSLIGEEQYAVLDARLGEFE